jgi:regulator of replication initiation timing
VNNVSWIIVLGFTALAMAGFSYYYENKINNLTGAIEDYKRALRLSKQSASATHYTYLQLENYELKQKLQKLENKNNKSQYEYVTYKSEFWDQ